MKWSRKVRIVRYKHIEIA